MAHDPISMDGWFNMLVADHELSSRALHDLDEMGFIVLPGPVPQDQLASLADAYDDAVESADSRDVSIGRTTTRVHDLVNLGSEFDELYAFRPVLEACCRIIRQPFKLSTMLARTLHPRSPTQELHVDIQADANGWPMVGFILMIDEFRSDNGATRLVPGSHKSRQSPREMMKDTTAPYGDEILACGPAGSLIIYNGSIWHGHSANQSSRPRRSIQGAFIRRDEQPAVNQRLRIRPETFRRLGGLAKYLLDLRPT